MPDQIGEAARKTEPTIFDLDGVLTRRDTLTALIVKGVVRRPWRGLSVVQPFWVVLRHGDDLARREPAVRRIVAVVLGGVTPTEVDRWCGQVGRRAARSRAWVRPTLVDECRRRQESGHGVVVATATEERIARAVLDTLGLEAELVLGSVIASAGGDVYLARYNYGPAKLSSLLRAGHPVDQSAFYTDSRSDLPVASAARRTVLVQPSAKTLAAYAAAGVTFTRSSAS